MVHLSREYSFHSPTSLPSQATLPSPLTVAPEGISPTYVTSHVSYFYKIIATCIFSMLWHFGMMKCALNCCPCLAVHALLSMPCYPCLAIHALPCYPCLAVLALLSMHCCPCLAIHALLSMPCCPYLAVHTLLSMPCCPCLAVHTLLSMPCCPYLAVHGSCVIPH